VAAALTSLQQAPLELTKDEHLLALIPIDDQWRREIEERLNPRNIWSIKASLFVGWVLIPFFFTVISSFGGNSYEGHALATLWLGLPCLVIGWSWVPIFESGELKSALDLANEHAEAAARKPRQARATTREAMVKAKTPNRPPNSILPRSKKRVASLVPEVNEENEKVEVESIQENIEHAGEEIYQNTAPPSNPTQHQPTVPFQSPPESQQSHDYLTVSANPIATQSTVSIARSTQTSINPETDELFILQKSTLLNRDQRRLSATFNYSRILGYLAFVDDVFRALNVFTRERVEVGFSRKCQMLEVVSLILDRGGLPLQPQPLRPWGGFCTLREQSPRCYARRFLPSFSSAE
jgi:hypothetical protein